MKKINVVGTSGSGKTTFARLLSKKLDYPYLEMDAIFWGKDWYEPDDAEFFPNLAKQLSVDNWVLDGNYTRSISVKWQDVDTVIWIDFGFFRTFYQALKRGMVRAWHGEELWPGTGNKESFGRLFSRESVLLWTLKTYHLNKRRNSDLSQRPEYRHINFVRLKSPAQCKDYLSLMHFVFESKP